MAFITEPIPTARRRVPIDPALRVKLEANRRRRREAQIRKDIEALARFQEHSALARLMREPRS